MIQHENQLMDHRVTWLLAVESFLFAGLAFAWEKDESLAVVICFGGSIFALLMLPVLVAAHSSIESMTKWWHDNRDKSQQQEPDVIGFRQNVWILKNVPAWYTLPVAIMIAWSTILLVQFQRPPLDPAKGKPDPVVVELVIPEDDGASRRTILPRTDSVPQGPES
ncbi:MAG: hypothetical protein ACFCBV_02880 [Phycisphaerales bacterium]